MSRDVVRTLLVEDSDTYRQYVIGILDDAPCFHYQVAELVKMREAIAFLNQHEVDLVLLDLNLPDSSGIDSVRKIKDVCGMASVVAITATDDDLLERACIRAGAGQYIVKGKHDEREERRLIRNAVEFSWSEKVHAPVKKAVEKLSELVRESEEDPNLPPFTKDSVSTRTDETVVNK